MAVMARVLTFADAGRWAAVLVVMGRASFVLVLELLSAYHKPGPIEIAKQEVFHRPDVSLSPGPAQVRWAAGCHLACFLVS
ncbi:MAG: hypothetical protein MR286_06875, partial [Clostridiales bacterium]|nr:hypothetical protein [Clostridiales bacterium]